MRDLSPSHPPRPLSPLLVGVTLVFWITLPASSRAFTPQETIPEPEKPQTGGTPPLTDKAPASPPAAAPMTVPAPALPPLTGNRLTISRFTHHGAATKALTKAFAALTATGTNPRETLVALAGAHPAARMWLYGLDAGAGRTAEVLGAIPKLRVDFPELKDHLVLLAARMHFKSRDFESARSLAQVVEAGPYGHEGLALQILVAREKDDATALEALLKKIIESSMVPRTELAAYRVELATAMRLRKAPVAQWLPHLQWVWTQAPLSSSSRAADALARAATGKDLASRATCAEKIARAEQLAQWQLHDAVLATLTGVKACSRDEQCQMLYLQGRALSYQKKRKEAEGVLFRAVTTCEKTKNLDLRVRTKFLSGRNARRAGKVDLAAAYYKRVHKEHPDSTYADDGLYHEALAWFAKKNPARALTVLRDQVKRHPRGDMADEARWRIVLHDLEAGKWADASRDLAAVRQSQVPIAPFEDWGRLLYWQGRCAQLTGHADKAKAFYMETVATAPVTYYSLLALHRLEEQKPGDGTALLTRLLSATSPSTWPWSGLEHADFGKPAFARLVQFSRLGMGPEVDRELSLLGRELPAGPVPDADRPFWRGMMFAYLLVDAPVTAMRLQGRVLFDHAQGWPAGNLRRLWEIAYPRPFETETKAAAAKFNFSVHHLTGLTREESLFNADIRSTAGALGLAQLMPATARGLAARAGVTLNTDADILPPANNLLLAAAYLSRLDTRFNRNPILVTGAYNAGETAITRWRAQRASLPIDLWVERLEVSETRNYIKRVLSSMFAYHLLAGEKGFPRIDLK